MWELLLSLISGNLLIAARPSSRRRTGDETANGSFANYRSTDWGGCLHSLAGHFIVDSDTGSRSQAIFDHHATAGFSLNANSNRPTLAISRHIIDTGVYYPCRINVSHRDD
jgi:hypothetical protein